MGARTKSKQKDRKLFKCYFVFGSKSPYRVGVIHIFFALLSTSSTVRTYVRTTCTGCGYVDNSVFRCVTYWPSWY